MGRKPKPKKSDHFGLALLICMGIAVILVVSVLFYEAMRSNPQQPQRAGTGTVPVYYTRAENKKPFPATLDPRIFKRTDVREAYQVAKEIPDVLAQQPCYCYCQRKGHRGLLDCFRTDHAASCDICIRETLLAGEMHRQGKSAEEIRSTIMERQWANLGGSSQ